MLKNMENCLVTKLNGIVDNDNLKKFGEVIIEFTSTSQSGTNCFINAINFTKARVIGDGFILDANGSNPVKSKDIPADGKLYFSAGQYKLGLTDMYADEQKWLREGGEIKVSNVYIDIDTLGNKSYEYIGHFYITSSSRGNLSSINCQNLKGLGLEGNALIEGNIEQCATSALEFFQLPSRHISGNIEAFAISTKLYSLHLNRSHCNGELNTLVRGMIENGRKSGTLSYRPGFDSTYDGNVLQEFVAVDISFTSQTSYTVTISGNTDTWNKVNGVWVKS